MIWHAAAALLIVFAAAVAGAAAQESGATASMVPPEISAALRKLDRAGGDAVLYDTAAIYAPLQARAPTGNVRRTPDVSYGPADRHLLDVYAPELRPTQPVPMLVFVHGGSFTQGAKSVSPDSPLARVYKLGYYFNNVGYYFARHGIPTIVADYRLAPQHKWPSGAEDMAQLVQWVRSHAADFGGDPRRIFLMGHSAGATHVAAYGLMKRFQPGDGPGLAGLILVSGIYEAPYDYICRAFIPRLEGRCPAGAEAYYGSDKSLRRDQSILANLDGPFLPVLIVYAELDSVGTQVMAGQLFGGLCHVHKRCPVTIRLSEHAHMSEVFSINTPDESLGKAVLEFMNRIR